MACLQVKEIRKTQGLRPEGDRILSWRPARVVLLGANCAALPQDCDPRAHSSSWTKRLMVGQRCARPRHRPAAGLPGSSWRSCEGAGN